MATERLIAGAPNRLVARMSRMRRAIAYPVYAIVIAMGAPLGLLVLRLVTHERATGLSLVVEELQGDPFAYLYVTLSTSMVFGLLGFFAGRAQDGLKRTSMTDALTGLHNRRAFSSRLAEELARPRARVAVLMADLDGLKGINDRLGHDAGDHALREVGHALVETCRTTDFVARYGGDEFAVIAPRSSGDAALDLAKRICAVLVQRSTANPTSLGKLSVSIGVADTSAVGTDAEALVACADATLFDAKRAGRNCARLFEPVHALVSNGNRH